MNNHPIRKRLAWSLAPLVAALALTMAPAGAAGPHTHAGTLTVCSPPTSTTNCVSHTGPASDPPSGSATVSKASADPDINVDFTGGQKNTKYSIKYTSSGSTTVCHDGGASLELGGRVTTDGNGDFNVDRDIPDSLANGDYRVCVQDEDSGAPHDAIQGVPITLTS